MNSIAKITRQLDSHSSLSFDLVEEDISGKSTTYLYITYHLQDGDIGSRLESIKIRNVNTDDIEKIVTALAFISNSVED